MIKYIKYPFFLIFSIFIFFFYFKDLGLENINEDQYRWYDRTHNFFSAIEKRDFDGTYQQYHPGIFFIYLLKLGFLSFESSEGALITNFRDVPYNLFPTFNFHTKLYLIIFILFSIFLVTYLIKEIFGKFIALSFIVFLTFDTYFIGLTRNLHMDSLLAILILVSIISFYRYLQTKEKKYLIISIFYSGLGLLTKSVFVLAFLIQGLTAIYFSLNHKLKLKPLIILVLSTLGSFLIFIALFPSMWVAPYETLSKIYIDGAVNTGLGGDDNFMHYVNNYEIPNPGFKFYLHVFIYRLSPMLLFSMLTIFLFYLYQFIKTKKIQFKLDPLVFLLAIFTIVYLTIIFYSSKKTDRYISIVLPPIALLTAYYLKDVWVKLKGISLKILFVTFTGLTIVVNTLIHPFYFAIYNPLFGGINEAQKRIYINQGGIGYLEVIKEISKYPNLRIKAVNNEELSRSTNLPISNLDMFNYKEENSLKVLPLQRGNNFIYNSTKIQSIYILNQEFWRIYIN